MTTNKFVVITAIPFEQRVARLAKQKSSEALANDHTWAFTLPHRRFLFLFNLDFLHLCKIIDLAHREEQAGNYEHRYADCVADRARDEEEKRQADRQRNERNENKKYHNVHIAEFGNLSYEIVIFHTIPPLRLCIACAIGAILCKTAQFEYIRLILKTFWHNDIKYYKCRIFVLRRYARKYIIKE